MCLKGEENFAYEITSFFTYRITMKFAIRICIGVYDVQNTVKYYILSDSGKKSNLNISDLKIFQFCQLIVSLTLTFLLSSVFTRLSNFSL